jgi:predicted GIY-YIG superfamily endonuclease
LKRLVFVERHEEILAAIQREKTMKHGHGRGKIKAIVAQNPDATISTRNWPDFMDPRNKSAGDV